MTSDPLRRPRKRKLVSGPEIVCRGWIYEPDVGDLLADLAGRVRNSVESALPDGADVAGIERAARRGRVASCPTDPSPSDDRSGRARRLTLPGRLPSGAVSHGTGRLAASVSVPLSTVGITVATRTCSSSSGRSGSGKSKPRRSTSTSSCPAKRSTSTARSRSTKGSTGRPRTTRTPVRQDEPSALRHLVDGHGHDLWGIALLILAVVVGVSVYSDTAGALGESVGSFVAALLGGLSFLVPPALAVGGVLLIRGPRERHIDLESLDEDAEIVGGEPRSPAVVGLGVVLGVLVAAGILDLLFAEQRTVDADGFDAYADGGGLLGALPGGLAQVLGRWGRVRGAGHARRGVGEPHQRLVPSPDGPRVAEVVTPAARAAAEWFSDLFNLGADVDLTEPATPPVDVALFDQDADAAPRDQAVAPQQAAAPRRRPVEADATADGVDVTQLDLELGPAAAGLAVEAAVAQAAGGVVKQTVDTKAVEARGRVLERPWPTTACRPAWWARWSAPPSPATSSSSV